MLNEFLQSEGEPLSKPTTEIVAAINQNPVPKVEGRGVVFNDLEPHFTSLGAESALGEEIKGRVAAGASEIREVTRLSVDDEMMRDLVLGEFDRILYENRIEWFDVLGNEDIQRDIPEIVRECHQRYSLEPIVSVLKENPGDGPAKDVYIYEEPFYQNKEVRVKPENDEEAREAAKERVKNFNKVRADWKQEVQNKGESREMRYAVNKFFPDESKEMKAEVLGYMGAIISQTNLTSELPLESRDERFWYELAILVREVRHKADFGRPSTALSEDHQWFIQDVARNRIEREFEEVPKGAELLAAYTELMNVGMADMYLGTQRGVKPDAEIFNPKAYLEKIRQLGIGSETIDIRDGKFYVYEQEFNEYKNMPTGTKYKRINILMRAFLPK